MMVPLFELDGACLLSTGSVSFVVVLLLCYYDYTAANLMQTNCQPGTWIILEEHRQASHPYRHL